MPRVSKGIYGKYNKADLEEAVGLIKAGKISIRKAAGRYNIPKSTLSDHVSGKILPGAKAGKTPAIPADVEAEMTKKIIQPPMRALASPGRKSW